MENKYYWDILKNNETRVMYGTEQECKEYCQELDAEYIKHGKD